MKKRVSLVYCMAAVIVAMTLGVVPLYGAVAISTDDLVMASDVILRGVVEQTKSTWDQKAGTIITRAQLKVTQVIRGDFTAKTAAFEYEGGTVGDLTLQLRDVVSVVKGEDVIVFLKTKPGTGKVKETVFLVHGDKQGKYTVKDGTAIKELDYIEGNPAVIDNNVPIGTFIKKIRGVTKNGKV
ncbi:MAG: hypothetical protein HQL05_07690 [Nitrospirae bacterium]|uniref:hypothetical protein n=1 Tax=Candidatus Magnetobacterium casense TaxID=1455061 RepID=UPI0012DE8FEA|nr:hypothetical protein [Candidatus Magnetobacterium casensis]MBF0337701.1 hypothetical protein [Nitrospirota bacterium]